MVDDLLASVSNTVILPFTADDDSVFVVNEEMAQFPDAWRCRPTGRPRQGADR